MADPIKTFQEELDALLTLSRAESTTRLVVEGVVSSPCSRAENQENLIGAAARTAVARERAKLAMLFEIEMAARPVGLNVHSTASLLSACQFCHQTVVIGTAHQCPQAAR